MENLATPSASLRRSYSVRRSSKHLSRSLRRESADNHAFPRVSGSFRSSGSILRSTGGRRTALDNHPGASDPFEFLQVMLRCLEQMPRFQVEYAGTDPLDPFARILQGSTTFTINCPMCMATRRERNASTITTQWKDIELSPADGLTVAECLNAHFENEERTGPSGFQCRVCHNRTLPNLMRNVKRDFPPVLNFVIDTSAPPAAGPHAAQRGPSIPFTMNPSTCVPARDPEDDFGEAPVPNYDLCAVIGTRMVEDDLRFVAYVKNADGMWFVCDEGQVTPISQTFMRATILSGTGKNSVFAYILFYCREQLQDHLDLE